jgi:hypothetical protein
MEGTLPQNEDQPRVKYVFVCGLPRSGTSLLGRNIARMRDCTGFRDTGVFEDEGRFLQDVYPTEDACGGPGRFGFDTRAHLTEHSDLLTPENVAKLRAGWHAYWDNSRSIYVEKTPANILMTRFLQAAFPNSYFIVITRHPVSVSMAAQKWKMNVTSLDNMFEHWLHCHAIYERDKKHLKHVYELRYEDYVQNQAKYHEEIAAFLGTCVPEPLKEDNFRTVTQWRNPSGLRVPEHGMEKATEGHNKKYFDRWRRLLTSSASKGYYRYIARKYEPRFAKYGYSFITGLDIDGKVLRGGKASVALGRFCCLAADMGALAQRLGARTPSYIKAQAKAILPAFLIIKIRRARQKALSAKKTPMRFGPKPNGDRSGAVR